MSEAEVSTQTETEDTRRAEDSREAEKSTHAEVEDTPRAEDSSEAETSLQTIPADNEKQLSAEGGQAADSAYETHLLDDTFNSELDLTVIESDTAKQRTDTTMSGPSGEANGTPTTANEKIIFKKPSIFDGENKNAREWLNEFRLCATANGWDEQKQLRLIPVYLADDAAAWYDMDVNDNPSMNTMKAVQEAFIKQFSGTTEVADIEYRIDTARQKENEKPIKRYWK